MRLFTTVILTLLLFGCNSKQEPLDGFIIKGHVKQLNNSELLILKFINGGIEIDSISTTNNKFQYSGKVKEPYFVQLLIKDGNETSGKLTEFMLENSEISITGNAPVYDSVSVSGSYADKILKAYLEQDQQLSAKWDSLKVDYDAYVATGDTINRKKVAKQLNHILKVDRVELLKKYVSEHANTTVGALLPSFCTIETALTTEDYQELYESLSEDIKTSDYGKSLLEKFKAQNQ